MRKKKEHFIDDGRTVASMEGISGTSWRKPAVNNTIPEPEENKSPPLGKKEARRITLMAILVALGVAGIFLVAGAVFIWFCINIWFA